MKFAHFVEIRVFSKQENNEEMIIKKVHELIPLDFKKEKIELKSKTFIGDEDKKIKIITAIVKKERQTRLILQNLSTHFNSDQKHLLLSQIESRLDSQLHFFIRLDKDRLLGDEYLITDGGNCFHIKIAVAAYPHKREIALLIVRKWLDEA